MVWFKHQKRGGPLCLAFWIQAWSLLRWPELTWMLTWKRSVAHWRERGMNVSQETWVLISAITRGPVTLSHSLKPVSNAVREGMLVGLLWLQTEKPKLWIRMSKLVGSKLVGSKLGLCTFCLSLTEPARSPPHVLILPHSPPSREDLLVLGNHPLVWSIFVRPHRTQG